MVVAERCKGGSVVARLLGLRVRIPPGVLMLFVKGVCCQVEVSATGRSRIQRSPTDCGMSLCVIQGNSKRQIPAVR